jgi:hypothetical protein
VAADSRVWAHINPNVPAIARVYDYWLGGKDNFAVDRELAERFVQADPMVIAGVRSNRAFLRRAVRVPRQGRRHQAVPRRRHRHPDGEQHPRGGAGGRSWLPRRLRGQ